MSIVESAMIRCEVFIIYINDYFTTGSYCFFFSVCLHVCTLEPGTYKRKKICANGFAICSLSF